MPAGTGVCVVNTCLADAPCRASSKLMLCFSTSRRMRSRARNAECPSFMWQTFGSMPIAASARTPPIPSTISCLMRISMSPP